MFPVSLLALLLNVTQPVSCASADAFYRQLKLFGPPPLPRNPICTLIEGRDGRLYGTTARGGTNDAGTVFAVSKDGGTETVLHEFGVTPEAMGPRAGVLQASDGALYGTLASLSYRFGVVYFLETNGANYRVLHSFLGGSDGSHPAADLIEGADGMLYGTASAGGSGQGGTVFKLRKDGAGYSNLHQFISSESPQPLARLLQTADGKLYGTTAGDAIDHGSVFSMDTNGGSFTVMHHFAGNPDGASSTAPLIQCADGLLYGTTALGGPNNFGALFRLGLDGTGYTVFHSFGAEGTYPYVGLVEVTNGLLYGTTYAGGSGTVFAIHTDGSCYTIAHGFGGLRDDGDCPYGLLLARDGDLYGVTENGPGETEQGTLFKVSTSEPPVTISAVNRGARALLLRFSGAAADHQYEIQATPSIAAPADWHSVTSALPRIDGTFEFLDTTASNAPSIFYRTKVPEQGS